MKITLSLFLASLALAAPAPDAGADLEKRSCVPCPAYCYNDLGKPSGWSCAKSTVSAPTRTAGRETHEPCSATPARPGTLTASVAVKGSDAGQK
ncbi:hypothetical protein AC579_2457 [Pseudocercospora musae]|uniref:Uncharacterized protein n=1 Tax=Pseudocercospora musae TaxID=113226 RepID=A0A139IHJ4_9PEZI|nr:hypothetical protein AC579_2457 [Pseudocercospora musae]